MALVGYARVSTNDQETRSQRDALRRAGVRRLFEEKTSSVGARPELQNAIASMRPGDVLVVWKFDRVARSLFDLLGLIERLKATGCSFRSITEPVDTSMPVGVFFVQVLGAVAQLERAVIRERALAGQVAAYKRGMRWGGANRKLTDCEREEVAALIRAGVPTLDVADAYGISKPTATRTRLAFDDPSARSVYRPRCIVATAAAQR